MADHRGIAAPAGSSATPTRTRFERSPMEHGHTYAGAEAAGTSNAATGRRTTNARPQAARRHNIYAIVHKALRACMGVTLIAVGRMDPTDDVDVGLAIAQVRELLT